MRLHEPHEIIAGRSALASRLLRYLRFMGFEVFAERSGAVIEPKLRTVEDYDAFFERRRFTGWSAFFLGAVCTP